MPLREAGSALMLRTPSMATASVLSSTPIKASETKIWSMSSGTPFVDAGPARRIFAGSSPVSGLPPGIAGAKFHSLSASPRSGREKPPVPSWDPGGTGEI